MNCRCQEYEQMLREVESILDHVGIYCAGVYKPDGTFEPRTPWQDGHNEATINLSQKVSEAIHKDNTTLWTDDERLLSMFCEVGSTGRFEIFLSDTFYYACADCETIKPEDVKEAATLARRFGDAGLIYFAAKKRGHDPEIPRYKRLVEAIRSMAEAS